MGSGKKSIMRLHSRSGHWFCWKIASFMQLYLGKVSTVNHILNGQDVNGLGKCNTHLSWSQETREKSMIRKTGFPIGAVFNAAPRGPRARHVNSLESPQLIITVCQTAIAFAKTDILLETNKFALIKRSEAASRLVIRLEIE